MLKKYLPHKDEGFFKKLIFWVVAIGITLGIFGTIVVAGSIAILSIGLPDIKDIDDLNAAQSTEIFDKEENLLYTIHGEENREHIKYQDIAQSLKDATISIEDDGFWEHKGFDFWALGRVALYEILGIGSPRGGSTITQQYIKNAFLSSERSYTRKAKELILALRLERNFSKEEILSLYLNRIPYGNNAYGCQKASEIYFDKNAKELSLAESSILAALPQAPSRYNPFGNNKYSHLLKEFSEEELFVRNIESEIDLNDDEYVRGLIGHYVDLGNEETVYLIGRTDLVLKRMYDIGKISMEERKEALNDLQLIEFNDYQERITYPHFVIYIKQILEERYGKDLIEQGGLKVYTTIDPELQDYAEELTFEKGETYEATYGANNIATFTINPKTGHILSMIGSRDYFNEEIDGNVNVVLRPRQPGSSFKPLVYAQAFYEGYSPGNVIYDIPTKIGQDEPENWDGEWSGQITIREGLGKSRNIPAIKAYFLAKQQDPIIDLAERMGITTLNKSHSYGYPLALGAGEISLMEMVKAYGTFANMGKRPEITGILKIENANGDVLEEWREKELEEVLDPQIAYLITNILSDRTAAVGSNLFIPGVKNAGKTGTSTKENKKESEGNRVRPSDAWTLGYTPNLVTGVWVGNTDGEGMGYTTSGYGAASPIFNAIMKKAVSLYPVEATESFINTGDEEGGLIDPFEEPDGIKHVRISTASGLLPGPKTPTDKIREEVFASFAVPTEVEDLFFTVEVDKISGKLATQYTPSDAVEKVTYQNYRPVASFFKWAEEIRDYYKELDPEKNTGIQVGIPPAEKDDIHTQQTALRAPSISITSPSSHSEIEPGRLSVEIALDADNGVEVVEYYVDDDKAYFTQTAPYTGHLNISRFLSDGSRHLVVAKVIDKLGYSSESTVEIKIEK
jgi:membrane peptidoglycan carboxypeptidase